MLGFSLVPSNFSLDFSWLHLLLGIAFACGGLYSLLSRAAMPFITIAFYLIILLLIEVVIFCPTLELCVFFALAANALIDAPMFTHPHSKQNLDLAGQIFVWHRISDFLIITSIILLFIGSQVDFVNTILLQESIGLFFLFGAALHLSYFITPLQTIEILRRASPVYKTFYTFVIGFTNVLLLEKFIPHVNVSPWLLIFIVVFLGSSIVWATIVAVLSKNLLISDFIFAFIFSSFAFIVLLLGFTKIALLIISVSAILAPIMFDISHRYTTKKDNIVTNRWIIFLQKGLWIDRWATIAAAEIINGASYVFRRVIWPIIIVGLFVRLPGALLYVSRFSLRFLYNGSAQQAIIFTLLTVFVMLLVYT